MEEWVKKGPFGGHYLGGDSRRNYGDIARPVCGFDSEEGLCSSPQVNQPQFIYSGVCLCVGIEKTCWPKSV